jgi:hypothetical protein
MDRLFAPDHINLWLPRDEMEWKAGQNGVRLDGGGDQPGGAKAQWSLWSYEPEGLPILR